jgi:hypothetical protein
MGSDCPKASMNLLLVAVCRLGYRSGSKLGSANGLTRSNRKFDSLGFFLNKSSAPTLTALIG